MTGLSDKEILSIKAIYYLAIRNNRLRLGGTYVDDINNYETCGKIHFVEAVEVVEEMLCRIEGARLKEEEK